MASSNYKATPRSEMHGTDDKSTRAQPSEPAARPQHLPFFFLFGQKGPETPQLVSGSQLSAMYGAETFKLNKKFANHATVFANEVASKGNAVFIKRLKPTDAGAPASLRLFADVLATMVAEYERNTDGTIKMNSGNQPIATGQMIAGHKVKFVVEEVLPVNGEDTFGLATQKAGDQVDPDTETQSVRIPILDTRVPDFGAYGKNNGLRIWAPTSLSRTPLDARIVANEKAYPFHIACVSRPDDLTSASLVPTNSGAQYITACFKPGTVDRNYDNRLYLGDVFLDAYRDLKSGPVPRFGPFNELHVYDAKVAELLAMVYVEEKKYVDQFSDINGVDTDEEFRLNLISGVSSQNVPYHSYQVVSGSSNSVRLAETSNLFAIGGSDGTTTDESFDLLVRAECAKFADENSPLVDMAKYPYSCVYDSGFTLETKQALCNVLALRKDTYPVLGTHVVGGPKLTAEQDSAMAVALLSHIQMFPESEIFGTHVMRGVVMARSGELLSSQYTKALPLTLELASKCAQWMGAGNGMWKAGEAFDIHPKNNVSLFGEISTDFTPLSTRNKDWANGMVWPESFDHRTLYFPAFQTVYDRDDSVLNSAITMMAICELEKIGEEARRKFCGRSDLDEGQFVNELNKFVEERVRGRFDNRFTIIPEAVITAGDKARGFTWTLKIEIYAGTMRTVQSFSIESHRKDELA